VAYGDRDIFSQINLNPAKITEFRERGVNVKWFGAKGDKARDDYAAIQEAIDEMYNDPNYSGGIVYFPPGVYMVSQPLLLGARVSLIGHSKPTTSIKCTSSFPTDQPLIRFDRAGSGKNVHHSVITNLVLDCNYRANIGAYAENIQEFSGLFFVQIYRYTQKAVYFTGTGCQHFTLDHVGFHPDQDNLTGVVGIDLDGIAGYAHLRFLSGMGGNTSAPSNSAGIRLNSGLVTLHNVHTEKTVDGILVNGGVVVVDGYDGHSTVTNCVRITGGQLIVNGIALNGAATAIRDERYATPNTSGYSVLSAHTGLSIIPLPGAASPSLLVYGPDDPNTKMISLKRADGTETFSVDGYNVESLAKIRYKTDSAGGIELARLDNTTKWYIQLRPDLADDMLIADGSGNRILRLGQGQTLGFYGASPAAKPAVTGSRGGNAALESLLIVLAQLGLITDNTTA
jgi:hypothetical protein